MDPNHKQWNEQQQALRSALNKRPLELSHAVDLFLIQHAMTHAGETFGSKLVSFEDEVWDGLTDVVARSVPPKGGHSIVWCIWHATRCEDITMNMLVTGTNQLLLDEDWFERMKAPAHDTGNAMNTGEIANFSARIDIPALRAYRMSVGRRTRKVILALHPDEFNSKADPIRLQRVLAEGAVLGLEQWLINYWSGLTVSGLLLMPPTRHNFFHLNEAMKIKRKFIRM